MSTSIQGSIQRSRTAPATLAVAALAAAALVAPTAQAAPAAHAAPPKGNEATAAIQASLDTVVADGAVGITARVDSPTYSGAFASGKRAVNANPPALPNSPFRVASNTKMMVATAVLQQVQRGTWSLDTTIGEILPGLVPGHEQVTVEQLLSHTSGMPDALLPLIVSRLQDPTSNAEFFAALGQDYTDQDFVDAMLALPWVLEPGSGFSYSNAGYVVLGMMLEKVTGRSMADILKWDVFKPAGMNQTEFKDDPGMRGNGLEGAGFAGGQWYPLPHFNPDVFSSAGAVVSTTKDLNSFTDALLDGRLLDTTWLESMKTPRSFGDLEYGLGLYRIKDPCAPSGYLYGHDGGALGTLSMAFGSPDGTRQYSVGVNGRHFADDPKAGQPYDLNAPLLAMIKATC